MSKTINKDYIIPTKFILRYDDYNKVLVVRNPFYRLVSCFLDKGFHNYPHLIKLCNNNKINIQDLTFEQYVSIIGTERVKLMNVHWRPLYFDNIPRRYNYIVKLEEINEKLDDICKNYNYKKFPVKQKGPTNKADLTKISIKDLKKLSNDVVKNYNNYYSDDIMVKILEIYNKDFLLFNYPTDKNFYL